MLGVNDEASHILPDSVSPTQEDQPMIWYRILQGSEYLKVHIQNSVVPLEEPIVGFPMVLLLGNHKEL